MELRVLYVHLKAATNAHGTITKEMFQIRYKFPSFITVCNYYAIVVSFYHELMYVCMHACVCVCVCVCGV